MNETLSWLRPFLWIFGWAVFALIIIYLNNKKRRHALELIHKERMAAMEKGIPMPEWPDYDINGRKIQSGNLVGEKSSNPRATLGASVILIMAGLGLVLSFLLIRTDMRQLWPFGLFVVFVGFGLLFQYFLTRGGKA